MFWILRSYAPSLYLQILGMPQVPPSTRAAQAHRGDHRQPLPRLAAQAKSAFDLYVANPDVQTYPLEQIPVRTLIINTNDDGCQQSGLPDGSAIHADGTRPRRPSPAGQRYPDPGRNSRVPRVGGLT